MSLSDDNTPKPRSGRVFMAGGPSGGMEYTLEELTGNREAQWRAALDDEYMDRVKAKAAKRASEILAQAEQEAREIKKRAMEEGFSQGLSQADEQLMQVREDLSQTLARALDGVREGRNAIWESFRQDLTALTCAAVDKIVGLEIEQKRREVLTKYLDQAVEILETERRLTLRVHPEDRDILNELLSLAVKEIPQASQWRIIPDGKLSSGSLIVESGDGLVDSSISSRREAVMNVLERVTLPDEGMGTTNEPETPE
ncbi:MAG: hypothetical protein D6E12_02150 [Desulfovibrio sp.]|nr:MAG: hypothetical protein D6E12_02150 [Desulfovibrio sp.]